MESCATFGKYNIKYSKISLKKRQQLVREILEEGSQVSKSARKLRLSLSTAKLIVKRYKEQGTFFQSKAERAKRLENREKIAEELNEQRTPPIKYKTQSLPTSCQYELNPSAMIIPQPILDGNYWVPIFQFAYPALEDMILYQL